MSRASLDYASLKADLRANTAAEQVTKVSADGVTYLRSLYVIPTAERRENLLSLAEAVVAARAPQALTNQLATSVAYYSTVVDPMPAFGRLLWALRECKADEVDAALSRLVAA